MHKSINVFIRKNVLDETNSAAKLVAVDVTKETKPTKRGFVEARV